MRGKFFIGCIIWLLFFFSVANVLAKEELLFFDIAQPASEAADYWTDERQANALPAHRFRPGGPVIPAREALVPSGPPMIVGGFHPDHDDFFEVVDSDTLLEDNSDPSSRYPYPHTTHLVMRFLHNPALFPYGAVGKVFFTEDGEDYECSGSAIGNRAVLTAGHCVSDGEGTLFRNIVFIPAYRGWLRGPARNPAGIWRANRLIVHPDWHQRESYSRDVAVFLTNNLNGKTLQQTVGALGVVVNLPRAKQHYNLFGYSVDRPWNGQQMLNTGAQWAVNDATSGVPAAIGVGTSQTEGSSGGPWIIRFWPQNRSPQVNLVNGVNSYGYDSQPLAIYSPYFDTVIGNMIARARRM